LIIKSGLISPWDVELAQEAVDTTKGRPLGSLLVDMGLAQQEMIIDQLNRKLEQTLVQLFKSRKVDVTFRPEVQVVSWKILPSKTTADLILAASRAIDSPLAIDRVIDNPQKFLHLSQDVRLRYQQASTNRLEKTILHHADKGPRIEQILESNPQIDRFQLLKTIFGLVMAGLLEVSSTPPARDSLSIPQKAEGEEFTLTRKMVVEKFHHIGIQEPNEFLELPDTFTPIDIRRQYETLLSIYHPDQSSKETLTDLTHQLEAIFLELTRAYNILTRKEAPRPKESSKEPADSPSDTQVKLKTASTNYQYALRMLSDRKLADAMTAIQMSVDNDPGNSFYLFKMGQILRRIPGKQKEAELSYRRALDLDPLSTDIMADLASLYWENGMKAKANTTMRQAFSIDPSNTRLQKFWQYLQISDRTLPMKEIFYFLGGLLLGIGLATLM